MAMILKNNTSNQEFLKNLEDVEGHGKYCQFQEIYDCTYSKRPQGSDMPLFFHYNYRKYTLLELLLFPNNQEGI